MRKLKNKAVVEKNDNFKIKDIFNLKNKINIFYILLFFLPIIDLITALQTRFIDLSITLGVLVKGILFILTIYYLLFKCNSSNKKIINIYLLSLLLFWFLYLITKNDITSFNYLTKEVINLFKFSFYPILVIGLINLDKEKIIDRNVISNILSYTFIMYILAIFIPYITKTGFKSYGLLGLENGTVGWFYSANELGTILILLFSFIYMHLDNNNYLIFSIIGLLGSYTSFVIGTKVASFGILIVASIMTLYYLIYKGKDKWKRFILCIIILLVGIYSFRIGPTTANVNETYSRYESEEPDEDIHIDTHNNTLYSFAISLLSGREKFLIRVHNVYEHIPVKEKLFGLGFTPRKSQYSSKASRLIEMDYFDMFYRFGIIGFILLIMPIIYIITDIIKKVLKKRAKFSIDFFKYLSIWAMVIFIGFISGHVLGSPAVSFYLGIITLFMYKSLREVM